MCIYGCNFMRLIDIDIDIDMSEDHDQRMSWIKLYWSFLSYWF